MNNTINALFFLPASGKKISEAVTRLLTGDLKHSYLALIAPLRKTINGIERIKPIMETTIKSTRLNDADVIAGCINRKMINPTKSMLAANSSPNALE